MSHRRNDCNLYRSIGTTIYMKIFEEFKMLEVYKLQNRNMCSIKLQQSLYGMKQSGSMWYNLSSEYLIKEEYKNDSNYPCVFSRKSNFEVTIVVVYVDDINLIETPEERLKIIEYLKREFQMKDLEKIKYCLSLLLGDFY